MFQNKIKVPMPKDSRVTARGQRADLVSKLSKKKQQKVKLDSKYYIYCIYNNRTTDRMPIVYQYIKEFSVYDFYIYLLFNTYSLLKHRILKVTVSISQCILVQPTLIILMGTVGQENTIHVFFFFSVLGMTP